MSGFSKDDASKLVGLLGKELALFGQVLELTSKQAELIAADEMDAFDESLDLRQKLIDRIDGLHREADVLMQSYVSYSGAGASSEIKEIEDMSRKLRDIITQCAAQNDKNQKAALDKSDDYSKRISDLSEGRKGVGAYIQDLGNNPEMFDKMS